MSDEPLNADADPRVARARELIPDLLDEAGWNEVGSRVFPLTDLSFALNRRLERELGTDGNPGLPQAIALLDEWIASTDDSSLHAASRLVNFLVLADAEEIVEPLLSPGGRFVLSVKHDRWQPWRPTIRILDGLAREVRDKVRQAYPDVTAGHGASVEFPRSSRFSHSISAIDKPATQADCDLLAEFKVAENRRPRGGRRWPELDEGDYVGFEMSHGSGDPMVTIDRRRLPDPPLGPAYLAEVERVAEEATELALRELPRFLAAMAVPYDVEPEAFKLRSPYVSLWLTKIARRAEGEVGRRQSEYLVERGFDPSEVMVAQVGRPSRDVELLVTPGGAVFASRTTYPEGHTTVGEWSEVGEGIAPSPAEVQTILAQFEERNGERGGIL